MAYDPNGVPQRKGRSGPEVLVSEGRQEVQINEEAVRARFESLMQRCGDLHPQEKVVGVWGVSIDAEQQRLARRGHRFGEAAVRGSEQGDSRSCPHGDRVEVGT